MDYDEDKIRHQIIAGMTCEPWRVELEAINYGERLGVFYRSPTGIIRAQTDAKGRTEDQIAFALISVLMDEVGEKRRANFAVAAPGANLKVQIDELPSPYEGKSGRHPASCTCSKHKGLDGQQAA